MMDVLTRSTDRATWLASAESIGLYVRDGDGNLVPTNDVAISEVGLVEITPAILAANGDVITPAVMDTRWHVNFRMGPEAMAVMVNTGTDKAPVMVPKYRLMLDKWLMGNYGVPNATEMSLGLGGVEMVLEETVKSPTRVFL